VSEESADPADARPRIDGSRRALVFGGGGVLGFAWTVGALCALEREWGIDARASALTVGTSAGSMVAAMLGCGIEVDAMRRHHQGVPAPSDPSIEWDYQNDSGGALPPWPGFLPGSPRLFLDAMRHPTSTPPAVALSGLLPRGRGTLEPIRAVISAASSAASDAGRAVDGWPVSPRTWIVATDYDSGARVVFGRDSSSTGPVALADAVAASCAIPAWYSPVPIGNRLYIDGGTASNASVDVVLAEVQDATIDEVIVLAPMASVEFDHPRSPMARLERVVRRAITRGVQVDAARLRAAGARVVVLTPGPYDLEAMGGNLMNPRRRTEVLATSLLSSAASLRQWQLAADLSVDERDRSRPVHGPASPSGHRDRLDADGGEGMERMEAPAGPVGAAGSAGIGGDR
jgi:NTE family protein